MSNPDMDRLTRWAEHYLYYNDHTSQYSNVALAPVTNRSVISNFEYIGNTISTPPGALVDVYSFSGDMTRGPIPSIGTWINGADLLNLYSIRVYVHDSVGQLIPLAGVYVRFDNRTCFIAVRHDTLTQCTSVTGRAGGLYLSYWANVAPSDGSITVTSHIPPVGGSVYVGTDPIPAALEGASTRLWINGQLCPAGTSYTIYDYVEVISEPNLYTSFTNPVSLGTQSYYSLYYNSERVLVHLPKASNVSQFVLPHDCLEITVRDATTGIGRLFSRYGGRSVRQVTHQDWSLDQSQLQSIISDMGSSSVVLDIWVRQPRKQIVMSRDVNYIRELYQDTDTDIVQFLLGGGNPNLPWWRAITLEKSPWLSLVFTNGARNYPVIGSDNQKLLPPVNPLNTIDVNFFVSAIGYYGTATVLSSGMRQVQWYRGAFTIELPRSLQTRAVYAYVFINGSKLADSNVTSTVYDTHIDITLASGSFGTTDDVRVVLRDASSGTVQPWVITATSTQMNVPFEDFALYARDTQGNYKSIPPGNFTWRKDTIADGSYLLTSYPQLYGTTLYYYPTTLSGSGSVNLSPAIGNLQPLVVPVVSSTGAPILSVSAVDVFLNGKWLVQGIDFVIAQDTTGSRIIITNRSYLNIGAVNNILEWYVVSEKTIIETPGYANGQAFPVVGSYLFEPTLTEVFNEGLLIPSSVGNGVQLSVPNGVDGTVCEGILRYAVHVLNLMRSQDKDVDDARRATISRYLQASLPTLPAITQYSQHQVYSPWLQSVIYAVVNGQFTPTYIKGDAEFVAQFPDPQNLKMYDPTLVNNNLINRQFVSVAAAYTMAVPNTTPLTRGMLQRLISLTLSRANFTLGETPV